MNKQASAFYDFLIVTLLADLFDLSGYEHIDFVSRKIVDGLIENGIINNEDAEDNAA
tara:strand:+ start:329 stop:499 length:171 start_codon:yes stop_codon:yes gene_type:complete